MSRVKGFHGVSWARKAKMFNTNIRCNMYGKKQTLRIGSYAFEADAAMAYDTAARRIFGRFAKLNFPTEEDKKYAE